MHPSNLDLTPRVRAFIDPVLELSCTTFFGPRCTARDGVLAQHVVNGRADPRTPISRKVSTLQDQTPYTGFDRGAGALVNNSIAGCTAMRTTNGTVWVIDSVLLPQF